MYDRSRWFARRTNHRHVDPSGLNLRVYREEFSMERKQVEELLFQALETEQGGIKVYQTALRCVVNKDLQQEWQKYLEETQNHERIVLQVLDQMELDPTTETPGRQVVRHKGRSLVRAMEMALQTDKREAAELVAAECVVEAETKDHQNWELIGLLTKKMRGDEARALKAAHEEVEDQEDEHLYHTMGWARELWIQSLGMPAVLPPPEEEKSVKTAIGAARARLAREELL
jgi:rubrerythrin